MARKTFISYKYSEAQETRDRIIRALGDDAVYYRGETSKSPDLTDQTTETIKRHLSDMIYDTSVTIVVLSPKMRESKWIDWEIKYSLKNISRDGRTSHTNGIVAVIQKGYLWHSTCYDSDIIRKNTAPECPKPYIEVVKEDDFLEKPLCYIDKAYRRSQRLQDYIIHKV